ncbi:hypothetical protein ACFFJX_06850 [Pseudarcicella hirudinis]|uniref:hypothetical protein n=1 Tax=Pseudarcicella hirudinis TaxID=1079859 RepID=UPI0035EFE163
MKNSTFINQTIRIAEIIKSGFSASLFTLVLGGFLSPVPVIAQHGDREFRNRENDQRDRVEQPRHETGTIITIMIISNDTINLREQR